MADEEMTLAGLRTTGIGRRAEAGCREMVKVSIPSLKGVKMYRCKEYVDPDDIPSDAETRVAGLEVFPEGQVKRRRGRPKGSGKAACRNLPSGRERDECEDRRSARPKRSCDYSTVRWKRVERFADKGNFDSEYRCRCNTPGNHNYVPDEVCEREVGPKPR